MLLFNVKVKNGGGYIIDEQLIEARDGANAIYKYIIDYRPTLEDGDTIELLEMYTKKED